MRSCVILAIVTGLLLGAACQTQAQENSTKIGFEILQFKSLDSIIVWATADMTQGEFGSLELPLGWFKNQPREVEVDQGTFINSPGQEPGTYVDKELFGFNWRHVATVTQFGKRLDWRGQLRASYVTKSHLVQFDAGSTLTLLVSPKGEVYPRISRDANRTSEAPNLPRGWKLVEDTIHKPLRFSLPDETLVIRADNQDSFQGPIDLKQDLVHQ
jgi:hypothetical protein